MTTPEPRSDRESGPSNALAENELQRLLARQIAYYRAVAPEYEQHALTDWNGRAPARRVRAIRAGLH